MLTILGDVFATATLRERQRRQDRAVWEQRFVSRRRKEAIHGDYRFNPNRDLW